MIPKIMRLGMSNFRNVIANAMYLKFGLDFTYPVNIYAQVNYSCNLRCQMCNEWRINNKLSLELPASVWIKTFKALKTISNNIKINFAGGEIFLKGDIFDILKFCNEENIIFGVLTNGISLNKMTIENLFNLNPFVISISIDSLDNKIYHKIRGTQCLEILKANIEYLMEYKKKTRSDTIINLKSIVCKDNLHELDTIAKYAMEMNFARVTFDPVNKTTPECEELFKVDKKCLLYMIDKLIEMKKEGCNISNSEANIRQWEDYFDEKTTKQGTSCFVPLNNLYFHANGNVQLCEYIYTSLGNIKNDDIKAILLSEKTRELKKDMVYCKRSCVYCAKRIIRDYFSLGYKFTTYFAKNRRLLL